MQTNIERTSRHAIILSSSELSALATLIADHYEPLNFSASCCDGSVFHTEDINDLLTYENPSFRRIESLRIRGGNDSQKECIVSFFERRSSAYDLSITDNDDKCALKTADELGKRLMECKPFYSPLTRISPVVFFFCCALVWGSVYTWTRLLQTGRLSSVSFPMVDMFYLSLPLGCLLIAATVYMDKWWDWMFPKLWFSIGRQIEALDKRTRVRNWIFGSLILGLILGVVGNLITAAITKT